MSADDRGTQQAPAGSPSGGQVLAAVDRANRHWAGPAPGVSAAVILEHLALSPRSGAARAARSELERLRAAGSLERFRRHGRDLWRLTSAGGDEVAQARRAGAAQALPESPQHRAWADARAAAALANDPFRERLRERLSEATRLLEADPPPHSDAWFEIAADLRRAAWLVGSATHCLYEWGEPHDDHNDTDEHEEPGDRLLDEDTRERVRGRRAGRRNHRLWPDGSR
jgi:hypothetical protein